MAPTADQSAEATGPGGAVVHYATPGASDLVDGTVPVFCAPASGSTFPIGQTIVNCNASDAHGNTSSRQFTVTVNDTTPPGFAAPTNQTTEATGPQGASVHY